MRGRNQAIAGIAVLASIFALFLVMYLSWANVGAELVQGIQGRYFIPLIPFIALALPRLRIPHAAALRLVAAVPVLLLAAWSTGYLPALLIGAYDVP